jgi:hypothetical protein
MKISFGNMVPEFFRQELTFMRIFLQVVKNCTFLVRNVLKLAGSGSLFQFHDEIFCEIAFGNT